MYITLAFEYWRVTGCLPQGSRGGECCGTGSAAQNSSVVRSAPSLRISPVSERERYFGRVRKISFLGREWFAYGGGMLNVELVTAWKR